MLYNLFEATHIKSYNLERLYNALFTICLTCAEAQRAFSSTGLYFRNFRTGLTECHLDAIVLKKLMSQK